MPSPIVADSRLAIDWGKARIGVAVSQGDTGFAFPVETVPGNAQALDRLVELVEEYQPRVVYVGLPLTLRGERSFAAQWVTTQAQQLATKIRPGLIRMVDERMSTASASRNLGSAGRSQKRSRSVIDQAAAVEILQRALDTERATGQIAGEALNMEEL